MDGDLPLPDAPLDEGEDADACDVPVELVELHQLLELAAAEQDGPR